MLPIDVWRTSLARLARRWKQTVLNTRCRVKQSNCAGLLTLSIIPVVGLDTTQLARVVAFECELRFVRSIIYSLSVVIVEEERASFRPRLGTCFFCVGSGRFFLARNERKNAGCQNED